jgi:hypothetical protein
MKISTPGADAPDVIRTEHIMNISLELYRQTNMFSDAVHFRG